ncbi:MAG: hypothetical protein EOO52_03795 [Gammaproteobacteria bacterium]|nr:MAG: hypothetical protein EOO52_03795 [Gammaproteobacteria bacterium]
MKLIFQKSYAYLLLNEGVDWYLTFFTGGPFEIDICVKLNEQEITRVSNNQSELEKLIQEFKMNPSLYADRRIIPSVTG